MKRSNKGLIKALAIVLALITLILGATFAWFVRTESVVNRFETGSPSVSIVEVFIPPKDWQPGKEINKDVGAINTGNAPALVRISLEELLSKLATGKAVYTATDPISDTNKNGVIPVTFDNTGYGSAWKDLDSADGTAAFSNAAAVLAGLPTGVKVYFNKQTSGGQTSYSFVAWCPVSGLTGDDYVEFNGKLQAVDATFNVTRGTTSDSLAITNIAFGTYVKNADVNKDWAVETPANTIFTTQGDHLTALALSDPGIEGAAQIQLIFTNKVKLSLTGIMDDEWFYNAADGYFYYMGKLEGGNATSYLLDAVKLLDDADISYKNMKFDLTVKMDAIQTTAAALTSEWNLSGALLTKMTTYCGD